MHRPNWRPNWRTKCCSNCSYCASNRWINKWMNTHDLPTSWIFIIWLIGWHSLFYSSTFSCYFDFFHAVSSSIPVSKWFKIIYSFLLYTLIGSLFVLFFSALFHARQPSTQPSGRPTGFTNNMVFDYNTVQTGSYIVLQCPPIFISIHLFAHYLPSIYFFISTRLLFCFSFSYLIPAFYLCWYSSCPAPHCCHLLLLIVSLLVHHQNPSHHVHLTFHRHLTLERPLSTVLYDLFSQWLSFSVRPPYHNLLKSRQINSLFDKIATK